MVVLKTTKMHPILGYIEPQSLASFQVSIVCEKVALLLPFCLR
jgi:hypothetical protein